MIAAPYFEQIEVAKTPGDLFPDEDAARSQYRRLARIVHPDVNPDDTARAEHAFARLSELWTQYNGGTATSVDASLVYSTKRHTFFVGDLLDRGSISNVYKVQYKNPDPLVAVLKMPRSPKNNDLVANEITTIKTLHEKVPEEYRMYFPKTVDSFRHRDKATNKDRRAIVLEYLDGFASVRDVINAYPQGIDPRDMAWMARRLWVAVDLAHNAGLIHGAVFPEHVMIHPTMHGVVLIDWSYAQEKGEKLKAGVQKYIDDGWYGSNYDKPLDHRLDIRQAAYTLEALLGLKEARPFRAFFNGCRVASAPTAGQLFEEFDELLERLYGKRRYRPFSMPQGWRKEVP